jgi:hypothetical protein
MSVQTTQDGRTSTEATTSPQKMDFINWWSKPLSASALVSLLGMVLSSSSPGSLPQLWPQEIQLLSSHLKSLRLAL